MKTICIDEYKEIKSRIDSMRNEDEFIEAHKRLDGSSCKCDYYEVKDCGIAFIDEFLSRDWGRTIVYHYAQGAEKFIKSEYLSNYFKQRLKNMFLEMDNIAGNKYFYTSKMEEILNSSKTVNEMSEDEIKHIVSCLKVCSATNNRYRETMEEKIDYETASCFKQLLYKLDGVGVISYLKDDNYVTKGELADQILLTSGLNNSGSYYSGRGVNLGDLNFENLTSIFRKLLKIDETYALSFVEMVHQMKTLGATEFINSFQRLAYNGFKVDNLTVTNNNVSFDGVYGKERNFVSLCSISSIKQRGGDQTYQVAVSEKIKNSFMSQIRPILQSIYPNYDGFDSESYHHNPQKKIK